MSIIPENIISDIKNASDIVDVISDSLILKKTGRNFTGLCPFHHEKTPSFSVSPEKQIFHCFGCGEGGNVFSFLMKYKSISFPDSVHLLGTRYGIEVPVKDLSPEEKKRLVERERLLDLNKKVYGFFKNSLNESKTGEIALTYLKKRGFTSESIETFGMGFVPDGWDNLVNFIKKQKVPRSVALQSGLVINKEKGGFYDRFRNRIILPIHDISNQIVGFGGRVLDDSLPKYLNSPETLLYNKRRSLYGLNLAKKELRETGRVYIVEGYFDLIALWQHGIKNVVATLGTSLTKEHVQLLKGLATEMILLFDSDTAGEKAARRGLDLFMKEEVVAKVMVLPDGYDPDSFIFEKGLENFYKQSKKSISLIDFLTESAVSKNGLTVEGKVRIISDLSGPISSLNDSMARSLYIKKLSEKIDIDESAVFERIQNFISEKKNIPLKEREQLNKNNRKPVKKIYNKWDKMEKSIISMMLQFPEILPEIKNMSILNFFNQGVLKNIGEQILSLDSSDNVLSEMISVTGDEDKRKIVTSLAIRENVWEISGCKKLIDQFASARSRNEDILISEIKAAEEANDTELLLKLLNKKQTQAMNRR